MKDFQGTEKTVPRRVKKMKDVEKNWTRISSTHSINMSTTREKITSDVKELIIKLHKEGKRCSFISETLDVKLKSVYTIINRYEKGLLGRPRGHRPKNLEPHEIQKLHEWVDEDCQRTLDDYRTKIQEEFNKTVSLQTVSSYLKALHYTIKRIARVPASRISERMIEERYQYALEFVKLYREPEKIFFWMKQVLRFIVVPIMVEVSKVQELMSL